jgi:hypothetical protein
MGSLWEEMSEDGPEFMETFGRPIKFRGKDDVAMISRSAIGQLMADGGFAYNANHTVRLYAPIGSDYYTNVPKQGEQLHFFNQKHSILEVTDRRPSPWIDLSTGITGTS